MDSEGEDGFVWERTENYCVPVESRPVPHPDLPYLLGIDEAGRGPVLGPMVYAACYCPISDKKILEDGGYADSKTLTEDQRAELFSKIKKSSLGWRVNVLTARELSGQQLRKEKVSLNVISHEAAAGLIAAVVGRGVNVREVYVDTVGDPEKYQAKLNASFPNIAITVSKKADSLFPVVSAASICAKVTRDLVLEKWLFSESLPDSDTLRDYGCGYPGDSATKTWLACMLDPIFGFTELVRFDWSTSKLLMKNKAKRVVWPEEEAATALAAATPRISEFFAKKPKSPQKRPVSDAEPLVRRKKRIRHRYVAERHLERVKAL